MENDFEGLCDVTSELLVELKERLQEETNDQKRLDLAINKTEKELRQLKNYLNFMLEANEKQEKKAKDQLLDLETKTKAIENKIDIYEKIIEKQILDQTYSEYPIKRSCPSTIVLNKRCYMK